MSGSMSKSDQSMIRQFSMMIGALLALTVLLIFLALAIYEHEPKETNPNQTTQVAERIAPTGAVYAGNTGMATMQAAAAAAAKAPLRRLPTAAPPTARRSTASCAPAATPPASPARRSWATRRCGRRALRRASTP